MSESLSVEDASETIEVSELESLLETINTELNTAHHIAPKPRDKKKATLKIGIALAKAREEFASDKEFGNWCKSDIIEKCPTGIKKATPKTLNRYRKLADFSQEFDEFDKRLELCLSVGFTNIYKLMEGKHEELLKQFREGTIKADDLDRKLNAEKYLKQDTNRFTKLKADIPNLSPKQKEELLELLR
ncbi:hypothetical protein VME0621_03865 [Vibrio mediterranei]|uniref:hypothetical protein n=1 Tax=Vibrio mediterranei TaxID=689 RepID=UPI0007808CFD|nr:hypothetical protein [Vibrio mediterranei]SBO11729.1 hypothetical protein VME0621_03865 [Vibrio mediterranei]